VISDPKEQAIFRDKKIDGDGLTGMTKEDLERCGIVFGVVAKIFKKIPQDQPPGELSLSLTHTHTHTHTHAHDH